MTANRNIVIFLLLLFVVQSVRCQYRKEITRNNDYTSLYFLTPDRHSGFEVSLSAVLMFTAGAKDRNGLRWGGGVNVSKNIGDFKLSAGFDIYKGKKIFGIGTSYAGITYNDGKYGGSYYLNKYYQGDKQVSAIIGAYLNDFEIRFEDDILSLPFTGFKVYDRYRSAALEVRYRHFMIGTNIYTNEVNGLTDVSLNNSNGIYVSGKQISSPVYIGYANKNMLIRYGLNSKLGGYVGQSWWHQNLFDTPDFNYGNFRNHFFQLGVDKPYTLY